MCCVMLAPLFWVNTCNTRCPRSYHCISGCLIYLSVHYYYQIIIIDDATSMTSKTRIIQHCTGSFRTEQFASNKLTYFVKIKYKKRVNSFIRNQVLGPLIWYQDPNCVAHSYVNERKTYKIIHGPSSRIKRRQQSGNKRKSAREVREKVTIRDYP